MTIGRTLLALAALAVPSVAGAQGFDLDCTREGPDGMVAYGAEPVRYQIDPGAGRWCAERCETTATIARVESGRTVLTDADFYGDRKLLHYDATTGVLTDDFAAGTGFARIIRYRCTAAPFSGLIPYLAHGPRMRGSLGLAKSDFLKGTDGRQIGGAVGIEVGVDATGALTSCTAAVPSGNPALDAHSCALAMTRLRVAPAADRNGAPVAGTYRTTIRWMADHG